MIFPSEHRLRRKLIKFETEDEGPIGWVQSMDGFEPMVRILEGRFPSEQVQVDDEGRKFIEGVLSPLQSEFFGFEVGSMATFSPSINFDRMGVLIVGIVWMCLFVYLFFSNRINSRVTYRIR